MKRRFAVWLCAVGLCLAECKGGHPAGLEEFVEYNWELIALGDEGELDAYTISRPVFVEEAASLGRYEELSHLKAWGMEGRIILASDLDGDGREDVIEYHLNSGFGGEKSYGLAVYRNCGDGYKLMYSQPLFDWVKDMRAIAWKGAVFLETTVASEKTIYQIQDWRLTQAARIDYYTDATGGRLIFCEETYRQEGEKIEEAAALLSEEGPNSITPFFEQLLEGKELSREDSLFWGSGESWAGAGGRGQELSDRYLFTMRQWEEYAKREYGGKEYEYEAPRACQVFSSDINNDGVEEEYIKSSGTLGLTRDWKESGGREIPVKTGRIYGRHEGKQGLLMFMESGGKETDFFLMCGLDIWNKDLTPSMFWVDEAGGKHITYILYHDEKRMDFQIEGYEINGGEYHKVLEVEGYGEAILSKLSFESPDDGVGYTIEAEYPSENGMAGNRRYPQARHLEDNRMEERVNHALKERITEITEAPEWKEKWTGREWDCGFWVVKAEEEEAVIGYQVGIPPVRYEKYEVLETFIRIDMKTGSCEEIEE